VTHTPSAAPATVSLSSLGLESLDQLEGLKVPELKALLTQCQLSKVGKKADLVERLRSAVEEAPAVASSDGGSDHASNQPPATPRQSLHHYEGMNTPDLRDALKVRGMNPEGDRAALLERLCDDDDYAIELAAGHSQSLYFRPSSAAAPVERPLRSASASAHGASQPPPVHIPTTATTTSRAPPPSAAPRPPVPAPPTPGRELLDPDYVRAMEDKYLGVTGRPGGKRYREIVIRSIGMTPEKFTSGGQPSVTIDVLRKLAGKQDFDGTLDQSKLGAAYDFYSGGEAGLRACRAMDALCRMGSIETMLSSFIGPLQELKDGADRVHCSLNLNTETGRLSSRRPNLQNQPALEKDHYKIRDAFCAEDGNMFVVADYGQLELRLLAHITNCQSMIEAFESGGCFHSRTAVGMFDHVRAAVERGDVLLEWDYSKGEPPAPLVKDVYGAERRKAKTLNFSIAYGKTPHGLSKDWGVTVSEAQALLDAWYEDRPEVKKWQEETIKFARREHVTRTLMGRERRLPDITAKSRGARGHMERAAINTPIQGSAADVVMMAMLKLNQSPRLEELGYKLLLQIHDEVILEGPEENVEEALKLVRHLMENPWDEDSLGLSPLRVHLDVDAKFEKTWYRAK